MGSGEYNVTDDDIHVFRDHDGYWWAVGKEGSYGGNQDRKTAISIARDAVATAFPGRRIAVHVRRKIEFVITRVRQKPSSQWHQDSVP